MGPRSFARKIVALAARQFGPGDGETNGFDDDIAHFGRPAKADFLLRGVDVHIHQIGRQSHVQEQRRIAAALQNIAIGALDGEIDDGRPRRAAVDEHHLQFAVHAAAGRNARKAANLHHPVAEADGPQMVGDFRSIQIADAIQQTFGRGQAVHLDVVGAQGEFDADVRQRLQQKGLPDVRELGRGRAQKLAARGHVEEQVANGDVRAARGAGVAHVLDLAAENQDFGARGGIRLLGRHRELRNGGDGGERFAPEAHRGDGIEILQFAQLAGRMALDGQQGVVAVHAGAVVPDADQAATAIHHVDLDARGAGIDRIFDQLLEHGSGALHDLARGDLVDHRVGQHANGIGAVHGRWL